MNMSFLRTCGGGYRWFVITALVAGVAGFFGGRWSAAPTVEVRFTQRAKQTNREKDTLSAAVGTATRWDAPPVPMAEEVGHSQSQWKDYAIKLERLAMTKPEQAMQCALAQPNLSLRAQLRCAVLRGWAATDPKAAVAWAMARPETERGSCFEAVIAGASAQPDLAAQLVAQLSAQDPGRAADYGQTLVNALSEVGAFDAAVRFVTESPSSPQRLEAIHNAFALWGAHDPIRAVNFVNEIADPTLREEAFRGFANGWAESDPAALARYAVDLPPGERRAQAFANALPHWLETDPLAATLWIQERGTDPHPDFDPVILAVTTNAAVTARRPDLAVSLAESIADPLLRTNTLRTLALKWAESDAVAARRYVESSRLFTEEERTSLISEVSVGTN